MNHTPHSLLRSRPVRRRPGLVADDERAARAAHGAGAARATHAARAVRTALLRDVAS
jgi:hypothetical protein